MGGARGIKSLQSKNLESIYTDSNPLSLMTEPEKIDLLRSVDSYVRKVEPDVAQVIVSLSRLRADPVAASDGTWQTDIRPLVP